MHVEPADVRTLLVKEFLVDRLLFVFTEAALLIPSIIHEVCTHLVAEQLQHLVGFGSTLRTYRLDLLATPVCAAECQDFRAMVFINDTIFKFFVTKPLFLRHPLWHGGRLSKIKDTIICDAGLSRAMYLSGYGKFRITKRFNGRWWRALLPFRRVLCRWRGWPKKCRCVYAG